MATGSNIINSKANPSFLQSILNFITEYSFLTVVIVFLLMVFISVFISVFYNNIPDDKTNTNNTKTFDAIYTIGFALLFVIMVFKFVGAETIILGKKFDLGLGIYIGIIFLIAFVMGG